MTEKLCTGSICDWQDCCETAHKQSRKIIKVHQIPQLMASFNFFIGKTRTVLLAGLALKTHGSLVKGLMPLRAGLAGFFFNFMLSTPPNLKAPFFFNSLAANST